MTLESSYRRSRLAPRCRLIASWSWKRFQGLGCSPIKAVRELGLERRETVRSLSTTNVGRLREANPSTRGPGRGNLWWIGCCLTALPNSYVAPKELLKASKQEIGLKISLPIMVEDSYLSIFKIILFR